MSTLLIGILLGCHVHIVVVWILLEYRTCSFPRSFSATLINNYMNLTKNQLHSPYILDLTYLITLTMCLVASKHKKYMLSQTCWAPKDSIKTNISPSPSEREVPTISIQHGLIQVGMNQYILFSKACQQARCCVSMTQWHSMEH